MIRVKARDVFYIETVKHGSMIYARRECMTPPFEHGIMSKERLGSLFQRLREFGFACPHNSYLVNLEYVDRTRQGKEIVMADGARLPISRSRAKAFFRQLSAYMKQGNHLSRR